MERTMTSPLEDQAFYLVDNWFIWQENGAWMVPVAIAAAFAPSPSPV